MSESCDQIKLREFVERIQEERDKALQIAAKHVEYRLTNLGGRMDRMEKVQSKMIGIGSVLVVVSGLVGYFVHK